MTPHLIIMEKVVLLSAFKKKKKMSVCKTQMMPPPDHKTTSHFENIWRKSKSCGHAHLHYVYKHPTTY